MGACAAMVDAGVGEWKTYTAKREIRDLVVDRGIVWAATNGGLFSYRPADNTFNEFTTSEGLQSIDLTAVTADVNGSIWIGASNGFIHVYNPLTKQWGYVSDIALRSDPAKRINALQTNGDTLFILSDIGVSVFSISRMEFGDTYARFGTPSNQIVGEVTSLQRFDGRLWVGTRNGAASTSLSNPNPSAPETWQVYTIQQGLPSNTISGIGALNDTLFAGTPSGLAYFNGISWSAVQSTTGQNIVDVFFGSAIYYITTSELREYGGSFPGSIVSGFSSNLTAIASDSILGSSASGIFFRSGLAWTSKLPIGPPSNKFVGIAVDERGWVWSGTGPANGEGFMSFDGNIWRLYSTATDARLRNNNYYKVSIGRNNSKWVSNWGAGVVLVDGQGIVQKVLNKSNGLPPSLEIDTFFVVVGGVATDPQGVAWITNRTGRTDTAVVLFKPDSSLSYIVGLQTREPDNVFTDVVIDFNGTKWFANFSRFEPAPPVGFFYYNERYTLPGTTNGWGKLTSADGLTSDKVWSVAVDREGELWIGSDQGVTIIFDPASPRAGMAIYHPLRDQIVQGIAVDALNNKWIATKQGVFVLSPDGTTILDRYTVENTSGKLLDNDVASLAINNNTGVVYFGTEKGLSSLSTVSINPNRSFAELSFAPNPFYLPSRTQLTVDGLAQNSTIKILSIDGSLVKEIQTPGGRIGFWDGTDEKGTLVSSAIYLVVAYSENGSKVATGKVAVIRR
jgi:ligand-binding sensor domain-containing protein